MKTETHKQILARRDAIRAGVKPHRPANTPVQPVVVEEGAEEGKNNGHV
jgi:hypothetical protein